MKIYSDSELAKLLDRKEFRILSETADSLGLECYVVGRYFRLS
jgi:poly(A) polymerase